MANHPLHHVLRLIRRTACAPGEPDSDARLLARFTASRDGEAFAALVRRHGPLVLGVCRRVLADHHLAEDAFQATFLVLARKAASVRRGEALADWLSRVAFRVAFRARRQAEPHRAAEGPVADVLEAKPRTGPEPDVRALLDEEVERLPKKYRALIALCYWEGKTCAEAAALLGRPPGTVAGWLARARQLLRRRLLRRGLAPAVAAAALATPSATAEVPTLLADTAVKAALALAAGNAAAVASTRAVALMEGVIRSMFLNQVKLVAVLLLALGAVGTAAGVALRGSPAAPADQPQPSAQTRPDSTKPASGDPAPRVEVKVAATFQHGGSVGAVVFSPDGGHLITAGGDFKPQLIKGQSHNGRVKLWDLAKGKEEAGPPPFRYGVQSAALGPDGVYLAVSTGGYLLGARGKPTLADPGELVLFDTTGKKPTASLKGPAFDCRCLVFSPDGKTLAAGTSPEDRRGMELKPGGVVALWDVDKGKQITTLKGHKGYVQAVAFSPDGKLLASASGIPADKPQGRWKGELKLWDLAAGKEKASLEGHESYVWCVAFSPDGTLVASGDEDGVVRLWDVAKGKEITPLKGHKGAVVSLAFSPDGKFLATGGGDRIENRFAGELKLWDVAARKEREALSGHQKAVFSVAFNRDGDKLASADGDGVVKLWAVGAADKP